MHENEIFFMDENEIFMHENIISMHENEISMHENEISMHENKCPMKIAEAKTSSQGQNFHFHEWKYHLEISCHDFLMQETCCRKLSNTNILGRNKLEKMALFIPSFVSPQSIIKTTFQVGYHNQIIIYDLI